ncbi:nitrile hydratase subunit beta [Phyllobacterium endophyticum]|uniref:nitrile hydratase subunit beta n=1 Tax=Phyllobacterium endophyticum TaxID=1149773 RepID=UPI0011C90D33|nr:nitrile hydratase subunit beta [Phyllobacterium endophyticum]TXR46987.1 nitrile hydratase subunit beta [Phyllobacterium endophyticum]
MQDRITETNGVAPKAVPAFGDTAIFAEREAVRILDRTPIGHYRVPLYLRGKRVYPDKLAMK